MKKHIPIQQVMTRQVHSVHSHQKVSDVTALLRNMPIHHVPVVDGRKPVGIISSADILRLTFDQGATDTRALDALLDHQFTVTGIMTQNPKTLPENASVKDAAELLADGSLHSVLVVDGDGGLAGIVTSADLIRFLLDQF